MSDEEHHFESSDAGASKTYPQQAGNIRKGGYIVIKGRPCKVIFFYCFSPFMYIYLYMLTVKNLHGVMSALVLRTNRHKFMFEVLSCRFRCNLFSLCRKREFLNCLLISFCFTI